MFTGPVRRTYRIEPIRDPVPRRTAGSAETDLCADGVVTPCENLEGPVFDYCEPVVGWRTWLAADMPAGARLRSVVFGTDWPPGEELSARCELVLERRLRRPWRLAPTHQAPSTCCECGIWAAKEIDYATNFLHLYEDVLSHASAPRVIGRVALWGLVVDGGLGWRASYAYPTHIYVPRHRGSGGEVNTGRIARGLADYGVPVEIVAEHIGVEVDRALQEVCGELHERMTELSRL
jgi:hypothetical protein